MGTQGAKLHNATFCQKTGFTSVLERGEEGPSLPPLLLLFCELSLPKRGRGNEPNRWLAFCEMRIHSAGGICKETCVTFQKESHNFRSEYF